MNRPVPSGLCPQSLGMLFTPNPEVEDQAARIAALEEQVSRLLALAMPSSGDAPSS